MPRSRERMWRNGPGGRWSTRIIWFEGEPGDIRLQMEDCERKHNYYPRDKEHAEQVWFMFRQGSPESHDDVPFISDLLKLLERT